MLNYARFNALAVLDALVQHEVTSLCAPPTVWRMLIQQPLREYRVANPARMLQARMFGDRLLRTAGAAREELADTLRESLNVRSVELDPPAGCSPPGGFPGIGVRQALGLGPFKGAFLDQHALPFISLPRATESHDNGVQARVASRAARNRTVSAFEGCQVRKVSAAEAQRRSDSIRRNRPLPRASPHSAHALSRTIQKTTRSLDSAAVPFNDVAFAIRGSVRRATTPTR